MLMVAACGGSPEDVAPTATVTPARFVTPAPFNPTGTPVPVAPPLADDDAIQVEDVAIVLAPPGECTLVENLGEPNRLGSVRTFDFKLGFGFGCPSSQGDVRLQEVLMHTASSASDYDTQCAAGGCDANRLTAADFDSQQTALQSGQAATGWTLLNVAGRPVLARTIPVAGVSASTRQYAEFCGDVRVENTMIVYGDDAATLEADADAYFGSLVLTCQDGG